MVLQANALADPHMQRGATLYAQNEYAAAAEAFGAALAIQHDLTPARFNLAVMHREMEQNASAEELFRQVIDSGEILAESYNNLGILAVRREQSVEGEAHFREAIRLKEDFPLAHFNLATLLLRVGRWEEGLAEYEWRWQTPTFTPIGCPQPQWDGSKLDGTLLLHTEQGIGDVFQFARFIPLVRERCKRLIFLRPDHLDCMFPQQHWADEIMSPGEISLDAFQATLPLLSAPYALKTRFDELPISDCYLTPEDRSLELGAPHVADARLKVGITWGGSPTYVNDAFRSISLARLKPILEIPRVAFYSLQVGKRSEELKLVPEYSHCLRDLANVQRDFADTAAIVRQLDLVIAVDTSVLHLCGGLGVRAWALLSRRSDWRWLGDDRIDSPWYPSIRLFRQSTLNEWDDVIQRVANELKSLTES